MTPLWRGLPLRDTASFKLLTRPPDCGSFGGKKMPGELEKARADSGSQPYVRLRFLCGLAMGDGSLIDGLKADDKYKLLKWPQIEREYPKHFRIATVMMKGPQTPAEITEGSGAGASEVADFINAYLAAGIAEVDVPPAEPEAAPAPKGFLGRLRGR